MGGFRVPRNPAARVGILFLFASGLGCSAGRELTRCIPNVSSGGFLEELLFPQGTARTPDFDDYTPGSYHVEKINLLEGVRRLRDNNEPVVGLIAYGPGQILWTYHVFLILDEGDHLRVNWLRFPHARITTKGTQSLAREDYQRFIESVSSHPEVVSGMPSFEALRRERLPEVPLEWHYSLLVADWSEESERLWHSTGDLQASGEKDAPTLISMLDSLVKGSTITYTTALPDGYDTNLCPERPGP